MSIKVHYHISQDRAGLPQDYSGARHFTPSEGQAIEEFALQQLAADYQVPESAIEIRKIEG
ncbi:MAG: hypothetical protein PHV02_04455 [Rhodocyclaceae bacterium]|nr:hypothetical protein [Rhodocyclaceae bacterium]